MPDGRIILWLRYRASRYLSAIDGPAGGAPGIGIPLRIIWKRQELAGLTTGEKERPAYVVPAVRGAASDQRVPVVPIATRQPGRDIAARDIPQAVKRHPGLDPGRLS